MEHEFTALCQTALAAILALAANMASWAEIITSTLLVTSSLTHLTTFLTPCSLGHHLAFPWTWLQCGLLWSFRNILNSLHTRHSFFFRVSMFLDLRWTSIFLPSLLKFNCWYQFHKSVPTYFINCRQNGWWCGGRLVLGKLWTIYSFVEDKLYHLSRSLQVGFRGWRNT